MTMQGGEHEGSYALNCKIQSYTFHTFVKAHLSNLCQQHLRHLPANIASGLPICVADFGCSHGRNTLDYAHFIVEMLRARCSSAALVPPPEIHYFFCDLPSNDFNSLFTLLTKEMMIESEDDEETPYFTSGVPGSFYERLFPEDSLHFAVSAYSLQWLSQIPPSVLDKDSPSWNGGHSWISGDRPTVAEAFANQFKKDLTRFLKCRAKELVTGAILYLLILGRPETHFAGEYLGHTAPWGYEFEATWADMVLEGLVDANLRDTFNIPVYPPCISEFEEVVKIVPELRLLEVKFVELPTLPRQAIDNLESDTKALAKFWGGFTKSLMNPMVEAHIGVELSKCFFDRLERKAEERAHLMNITSINFVCALLRRT